MAANNSQKPNNKTTIKDWKTEVERYENLKEPHPSYRFSKRTFKETDKDGVYNQND